MGKPSPLEFDQKFCPKGWDLATLDQRFQNKIQMPQI